MLTAAATGFATGFSLILAIGAQNAFVLRQGLLGNHLFAVCLVCALSDAILITIGVLGFGALTLAWPILPVIMRYGGAAFLIVYGALRFLAAWRGTGSLAAEGGQKALWPTVLTCLAFTWLNPHVYLDTFVLLGGISTQFDPGPERLSFGLAAATASFVFFFSLGYGAHAAAPWMKNPVTWRILDLGIAILMWSIAAGLLL